ncbi:hypothetical protein SAMN02799624_05214 [Paenibacillus sp. UNC496MF]|uniref:hypothetical protein n=1 Tax=Paenibacillus sp. UNC496MF TaxID=1502753 RepID=UPI0008F10B35|nr:hypothetical protein [Paenibacillus sp. UNC496MF]SFJ62217.1 hypothetical protein SAMN02799624_05214 [Paenibacillus sp. UNC496MF]
MARVKAHDTFPQYRVKVGVMPEFSGARTISQEEPLGAKDTVNKQFVLSWTPIPQSEQVFKDGMFMMRGAAKDYVINGKTIVFAEAPSDKAVIAITYRTMDQP